MTVPLKLERSHENIERQPVKVAVSNRAVSGAVEWRRFPSGDAWQSEPLTRRADVLEACIPPAPQPLMPAAGKLEYRVHLAKGGDRVAFPETARGHAVQGHGLAMDSHPARRGDVLRDAVFHPRRDGGPVRRQHPPMGPG